MILMRLEFEDLIECIRACI